MHISKPCFLFKGELVDIAYLWTCLDDLDEWGVKLRKDLVREIGWLVSFASQCAKIIVIPGVGQVEPLDAIDRLSTMLRTTRARSNLQSVSATVPARLLRSGHLAQVSSMQRRSTYQTADLLRSVCTLGRYQYDRVKNYRYIVNVARDHGHIMLSEDGDIMLADSIPALASPAIV